MGLDNRTIGIVIVYVALMLCLFMLVQWWRERSRKRYAMWAVGNGFVAIGWLLLSLRGSVPDFLSVVVANTFIALCHAFLLNGVQQFRGMRSTWSLSFGIVVVVFAGQLFWLGTGAPVSVRIVFVPSMLAIHAAMTAWYLLRPGHDGAMFSRRVTALVFMGLAMLYAGAATRFAVGFERLEGLFDPSATVTVLFVGMLLGQIGWSLGFLFMVAERRQENLNTSMAEHQAFFDQSPIGLVMYDREGRHLKLNEALTRSSNIPIAAHLGKTMHEILPAEVAKPVDEVRRRVMSEGRPISWGFDAVLPTKSAKPLFFFNTFFPIHDGSGEIVGVGGCIVDATELKQTQAQLEALNTELELRVASRTAQLEDEITERKVLQMQIVQASKLASLGEMATAVAHELNQPLAAIQLTVNNIQRKLQKGAMDGEYLGVKVDKIENLVERASAIIDHMRVFGRASEAEQALFSLADSVQGALDLFGEQLRLSSVRVELDLDPTCRPVLGHQVQMEQVVINLISNARDVLRASQNSDKKISIGMRDLGADNKVRLTICDNGGGVPAEVLDKIFDPFFTTKEIGQGTGLGLSISHGILRDMKGTIHVENRDGGACFIIELPVG